MNKRNRHPDWELDEGRFVLRNPRAPRSWTNFIANDDYGLRIGHMGDAYATTMKEPRKVITNYDFFTPNKGRYLYLREELEPGNIKIWNPTYFPVKNDSASYLAIHEPGITSFTGREDGLELRSIHMLPLEGCFELWRIRVENSSDRPRRVQVFPMAEFLLYDNFAVDPVYYSWYTNSRLEADKKTIGIFKTDQSVVYGFFAACEEAQAWESSLTVFRGSGDMQEPEAVIKDQLSGAPSAGDPYIGCFRYQLDLQPGQAWETAIALGEGQENLEDFRKRFPDAGSVAEETERLRKNWSSRLRKPQFEAIKETQTRSYMQSFMPYQIYQQSLGLVRSTYRGYRDVAQDAMGMSYYDLDAARRLILSLLDKQYASGRCLRQWHTGGGYNDERDFRDLPFWLPLAVDQYLENGGDPGILEEEAGFYQSEERSSLYEHMIRGLNYAIKFGAHGLLEMGKGDWNDALSGLGPKGESLWLNQIAYLALTCLERIQQANGHTSGIDLDSVREKLYQGVMAGWTGSHFLRAYHENGQEIGGRGDGRIFLLPQAWFTISGMSRKNPEIAKTALDSMLERCDNPHGLLICHPGYPAHDPLVGNLSALSPGVAENFAVYNHASAFGIYALAKAGRKEDALKYIERLLPFRKDAYKSLSEPYVLVNYYNGGYYPEKAGRGGIPWLTSTVSWLAKAVIDFSLQEHL